MGLKGNEGLSFPFPKKETSQPGLATPPPQGHAGHGVDLPPAVAAAFAAPSGATPVQLGSWNRKLGICWMKCLACPFFICVIILSTWRFFVNTWFLLVMRRVFGSRWVILEIEGGRNEKHISQDPPDVLVLAGLEASALTPEEQRAPFGSSETFGHVSKDQKIGGSQR